MIDRFKKMEETIKLILRKLPMHSPPKRDSKLILIVGGLKDEKIKVKKAA